MGEIGKIPYCLYARKSTEQDERQAMSIDSQIAEMQAVAEREGLWVKEVKKESHSAKSSGERPVFAQLIADIKAGKIEGIVTWSPDRLSRNAGDLGALVDLMDQGKLYQIRVYGQTFTNSPNDKFLLMILCSQAKLENDNKGINVKRGLRAKAAMGYQPGFTPLGYLNELTGIKGEKKVFLDPVRAPIIKEMFELVASHGASGRMLLRWLNDKKDFTTRSGKRITLSSIYLLLGKTYYYGEFEYPVGSGNWYQGKYEPIITKELFELVREQLKVPPKLPPGSKEFAFTKVLKCGACGSGITAEEKIKRLKNGSRKRYVYYHCTQACDLDCPEPFINEDDLLAQLLLLIDRVALNKIQAQQKLVHEIEKFNKFTKQIFHQGDVISKEIDRVNLRAYAKYVLREGEREEKRELLACLTTKIYLKERRIYLEEELEVSSFKNSIKALPNAEIPNPL